MLSWLGTRVVSRLRVSGGRVHIDIPIPANLGGLRVATQWAFLTGQACSWWSPLAMSDALAATILP